MARKRMIDPEFWSDEEIASWSYQARLFYIGLWNFSDDEGRLKAHPALLKSQIFPYDTKIDISKAMSEVSTKVQWYSVNGSKYGYLPNFLKHQTISHPYPSKIPLQEHSDNVNGTLQERSGKKLPSLKECNLKECSLKEVSHFEEFWKTLPAEMKKGRPLAMRRFSETVRTDIDRANIQSALENYKKSKKYQEGFIQNGSTWLGDWVDWIDRVEKYSPIMSKGTQKIMQAGNNFIERGQDDKPTDILTGDGVSGKLLQDSRSNR